MTKQLVSTKDKNMEFREWMDKRMDTIQAVAPRFYKPERLARIVLTEFIVKNPKLLDCTRNSVMGSLLQCATLGLEPGVGGQCWIIPYGNTATFVIGYRGLITLARRSKIITHALANPVHEHDSFRFTDFPPDLQHTAKRDGDRGPLVGVYSVAYLTAMAGGEVGATKIEYMTREEVEKIRTSGPSGNSPGWKNWYDEMAKAKVTKRNFKYLPTDTALDMAITADDELDLGAKQSLIENDEPATVTAGGQDSIEAEFDELERGE